MVRSLDLCLIDNAQNRRRIVVVVVAVTVARIVAIVLLLVAHAIQVNAHLSRSVPRHGYTRIVLEVTSSSSSSHVGCLLLL